jgi:hypothetical protein
MTTAADVVRFIRALNTRGNFQIDNTNAIAIVEAYAADMLAAQNKLSMGLTPQKLADYLEYGVKP